MNSKLHWEKVYSSRQMNEVSWYQPTPEISLDFINGLNISKTDSIIDVGGGDSYLVDHLLKKGFTDITVLDISAAAIDRAKERLGKNAKKINWIVSDITELSLNKKFYCWHDRAAFHFLTREEQVEKYLSVAQKHISENGKIVIGTFAPEGPAKCSGLPVRQYSEQSLYLLFKKWFEKIKCDPVDHITPLNTIQKFIFCSFKKINFK